MEWSGPLPNVWIRFRVGDDDYALPLGTVAEVTGARAPSLIPLVSLEVGGILNVRGEPLPAVSGHVLLAGDAGRAAGRAAGPALVLERGAVRIGVLVDSVSRIERDLETRLKADEFMEPDRESELVRWVRADGTRVGLIDAEELLERATRLLTSRAQKGEEPCPIVF